MFNLDLRIIYLYCFIAILNASLSLDCQKTPFWKLNLCQIDCQKCGANALCQNCSQDFQLVQKKCMYDSNTIYHKIYFTQNQLSSKYYDQKSFKLLNQFLQNNDVVRLCKNDSYKFDMIGLLKQQDRLAYSVKFDSPVTFLKIKFNFLTIFKNTKVQVILNGAQVFDTTYKGQNIKNTYERGNQSQPNYLSLPSLTQSSSFFLIKQIDTGYVLLDESQYQSQQLIQLQISFLDNKTNTSSFWAFSDFSVIGKKCQNCITQKLKKLSRNVGIAIGVTSGALILLVAILYVCVKFQQKRRLMTYNDNLREQSSREQFQKQQIKGQNLNIRETIQNQKVINTKNKRN